MMMKLYSWDISPYAARVRMQIYAKGLTDIATEQTPFFLTQKLYEERPLSRIPSLEIDGDAIPESAVIAEYLEEIYPEPSLLGATPRENAHIRTLARIGDVYLINTAFTLGSQTRALAALTPVPAGIESIAALLIGQLASSLRTLDRMIGRDGFACRPSTSYLGVLGESERVLHVHPEIAHRETPPRFHGSREAAYAAMAIISSCVRPATCGAMRPLHSPARMPC
jgi:glutathione S-transferase